MFYDTMLYCVYSFIFDVLAKILTTDPITSLGLNIIILEAGYVIMDNVMFFEFGTTIMLHFDEIVGGTYNGTYKST